MNGLQSGTFRWLAKIALGLLLAVNAGAAPWQTIYSSSGYIYSNEIYDDDWNVIDAEGSSDTHVISVPQAGTIRIFSTGSTDTHGSVHDGTDWRDSRGGGGGGNFLLTINVPAGSRYIYVSGEDDWVTGNYGITVEFKPGTTPPVVNFTTTPAYGKAPFTTQLSATATDADGQIVSYEWDFNGDGVLDAVGPNVFHTFYSYVDVRLNVSDNDGAVGTIEKAVEVYPANSYTVTVEDGTRQETWPYRYVTQNQWFQVVAAPPPGRLFTGWTVVSGAGSFWSASTATTYFTMGGSGNTVIRANSVPDTVAPSAPTNLAVTGAGARWVMLAWTAATDNLAVTGYEVLHNSTVVATATGTTVAVPLLTPSTSYQFVVRAMDYAGNRSASNPTAYATTQATEGPISTQVYDSGGTGSTYTVPYGTRSLVVKAWGAGGGGSANSTGGAGAAMVASYVLSASGQSLGVYPGGGGAAYGGPGASSLSWKQEPYSPYTQPVYIYGGSGQAGGGAGTGIASVGGLMVAGGGGGAGGAPNGNGGAAGAAPMPAGVVGFAVPPQNGGPGYGNSGGGGASLQMGSLYISRSSYQVPGGWAGGWFYGGSSVNFTGGTGGSGNGRYGEEENVGYGQGGFARTYALGSWVNLGNISVNTNWLTEGSGAGGSAGEAGDTTPAYHGGGGGGGLAGGGGGGTGDTGEGGGGGGGGISGFAGLSIPNAALSYVIMASGSGQTPPLTSDPHYPGGSVGRGGNINTAGGSGAVVMLAYGAGPAPVMNSIAAQTITQGTAVSLTAVATSVSEQPIQFTAINLPPGLAINTSTGAITGTAYAAGVYNSSVKAATLYGFDEKAVTWTVLDNDRPSKPMGLRATNVASATFDFAWNASSDNIGVTGYDLKMNGTSLGVAAGVSRTVSATLTGATYTMEVRARDAAGNWSDWSDPFLMKPYTVTVTGGTPASTTAYAGVVLSLTANVGASGEYFSGWTISGAGNIDLVTRAKAKFTIGTGNASLSTNYAAGFQLNTDTSSMADAAGGQPGQMIAIHALPAPAGYSFLGWEISGAGYIGGVPTTLTSYVVLAAGNMSVSAKYWDDAYPRPPVAGIGGQADVLLNQNFTITSAAICLGASFHWQQIDYSTDGGTTWNVGTTVNQRRWEGTAAGNVTPNPTAYQNSFTIPVSFSTAGTYLFRALAGKSNGDKSVMVYKKVNVGLPGSISYRPINLTASTPSGNSVVLSWALSWNPGVAVSYQVFRTPPGDTHVNIWNTTATSQTIWGLNPGSYRFKMRTIDWAEHVSDWSNEVDVTIDAPPSIVAHPGSRTAHEGETVELSVDAIGSQLTYVWQKQVAGNWTTIQSATTRTYTIANVQVAHAASYRVVVSNGVGTVESNVAVLSVNRRPTVALNAAPTSGASPLTVNFNASGTSDPDGTVASYAWAFGDGGSATGATTSHVYQPPGGNGTFTATLTVTDNQGGTATTTQLITVGSGAGADTDNDGVPNAIEALLSTNPQAPGTSDTNNTTLLLKIIKP